MGALEDWVRSIARRTNMEVFAALLLVASPFVKAATSLARWGDWHGLRRGWHWPGTHGREIP